MELTIIPALANTLDTIYISYDDSVMLAGSYQTTSGVYYDTLQTIAGCDIIIQTTLIIDDIIFSTDTITICQGDSALINGTYYTQPNTYVDTLISYTFSDSVVETTLIVNPNTFTIDSLTLCTHDSILLGGSYQTSAGVYLDTVQSQFGCDSILITYLDFDTVVYSNRIETICAGDSLEIGNVYYNTSGTYTNNLVSQSGCDSIESVELIVLPQTVFIDTISICNLDSIFLEGAYQNTSGNYFDTLQTVLGCDSVVETILSVDSIISVSYTHLTLPTTD